MEFKPTYLYIKTHNTTGLKYFGKTTSKDPYKYLGSGTLWIKHLNKYGDDISTEIYGYYTDKESCTKAAIDFSERNNIVESKEWANFRNEDGLSGGDTMSGRVSAKDAKTKKSVGAVYKDDPRWETGEIIHSRAGRCVVVDANNNQYSIEKDRYDENIHRNIRKNKVSAIDEEGNPVIIDSDLFYNGNYKGVCKDKLTVFDVTSNSYKQIDKSEYDRNIHLSPFTKKLVVKDKDGNTSKVSVDDPRYLSGELVAYTCGTVNVKDEDGNRFRVDVEDPRYLSGELVGCSAGRTVVKDKDGNRFMVDIDDPRFLNGELTGIMKGVKNVKLSNTLKKTSAAKDAKTGIPLGNVSSSDPRWETGEIVGINKGNIFINNGIVNKQIDKNLQIPEGWKLGKFKKQS